MHKQSNTHFDLDVAADYIQDATRLIRDYSERRHHVPTETELLAFHLVAATIGHAAKAIEEAGRQLHERRNQQR